MKKLIVRSGNKNYNLDPKIMFSKISKVSEKIYKTRPIYFRDFEVFRQIRGLID